MLLERDDELATLTNLIDAARRGSPAVAVIEGAAGLGKSRLLLEGRRRAADAGLAVFAASSRAIERDFGFGVVGQLFSRVVRHDADRLLGRVPAAVAAILAPEGADSTASLEEAPTFAALDGLYRLVVRLAEQQPLVLTVDDVHWCDAASLRFLAYLRNRLDGLPVVVLCTRRHNEGSADPAALDALLHDPATVWLWPRPLSLAATTTLIQTGLGQTADPHFASACHRVTGGNPLLMQQLVSALASERISPDAAHVRALEEVGPAAIASSVLLRLGRLGPDAIAAAQALAILDDEAELAHVADLAGLSVARAAKAVGRLAGIDVVRPASPLGFVHPLVGAAVYREIPVGERELRHLRAAELLRRAGAPTERVAVHLLRAPASGDQAVVDQLIAAAAVATGKGAVESACAYLQRAMTEPPVQEHLAEVAWMLGRAQASRNGPAAKANLRRAHDEAKDGRRRAEIAERLGAVLMFTGAGEEAIRVLRAAAGGLPPDSDLRHRLEAYELYAVLYGTGRQSELRRLEKYRSLSDAPGMGERMLAVLAATHWMYVGGPSDGVADLTLRALAGGGLVAERASWAAFGLSTLTYSDRPEAEDWWDRLTAAGYTAGSLTNIVAIMVGRAESLWRRGELSDAEQWISDGLSTMKQWGFGEPALTLARGQFSAILLDRGDLNGARRAWQAGRDAGANDPASRRWLGREIELLLAEHSYELATRAADKYAQRFDHLFPNPMDVPWRSLKALALDQLGRRDEARDLAQAELELARGWGSPATVARTLRTVGCLEGGPAAVATLEEAVALVEHSPARLEHARSLAALGGALHGCGRDAAARETMHEALAISTTCGAQALAAETRADLLAAGGRPRRTAVRGVDALTPGELRVARLAARGRTNREIGEELFVTPKTAAMHLSNAYRKLGVASRRDLAIALSSAGAAGFRDPELASGQ